MIRIKNSDFGNILFDKTSNENMLIYGVLYKTLIDAKLLRIMFDKIDRFVRDYGGIKLLMLFGLEKYNVICERIRYLTELKSGITYGFSSKLRKNQNWIKWRFASGRNVDFA